MIKSPIFSPDPNNPFALDVQPEDFTVDMVEQYPSFPTGIIEITPDGYEPVFDEVHSLLAEDPRVFVVKSKGSTALIELFGPAIDLEAAEEYLALFGRHVRGAHIREYGRLGAAIINACVAVQLDNQHLLRSGDDDPTIEAHNPIVIAKSAGRCRFERGIGRIEVELTPMNTDHLIHADREMRHWNAWLAVKATAPSLVRRGDIPAGVSFLGEQVLEVDARRKHRLVPGKKRPRFTSRNQIVVVTAPNGTACLMCLDTIGAARGAIEWDRNPLMDWLRSRVPAEELKGQDLQCRLYAEVAQQVVAHHRNGTPLNLPNAVTGTGREYPVLMDYRVVEAEFSAADIIYTG